MLAQNLKTPDELGLKDAEFQALRTVLGMLERGEIAHSRYRRTIYEFADGEKPQFFNMYSFITETDCGTACCICGWAEHIGHLPDNSLVVKRYMLPHLEELFDPPARGVPDADMNAVTPAQAAIALRNYLTHGEPRWQEAVSGAHSLNGWK